MMKIERIMELCSMVKAARANGESMIDSVENVVKAENLTPRERIALIMNVPSTRK